MGSRYRVHPDLGIESAPSQGLPPDVEKHDFEAIDSTIPGVESCAGFLAHVKAGGSGGAVGAQVVVESGLSGPGVVDVAFAGVGKSVDNNDSFSQQSDDGSFSNSILVGSSGFSNGAPRSRRSRPFPDMDTMDERTPEAEAGELKPNQPAKREARIAVPKNSTTGSFRRKAARRMSFSRAEVRCAISRDMYW